MTARTADPPSWGPWTLDPDALALRAHGHAVELDACTTPGRVLAALVDAAGQPWADDAALAGLVRALVDVLRPPQYLCPSGADLRISPDTVADLVAATTARGLPHPQLPREDL